MRILKLFSAGVVLFAVILIVVCLSTPLRNLHSVMAADLDGVFGGGETAGTCERCENNLVECINDGWTSCWWDGDSQVYVKTVYTGQVAVSVATDLQYGVVDASADTPKLCFSTYDCGNSADCSECGSNPSTTKVNSNCTLIDSRPCPVGGS